MSIDVMGYLVQKLSGTSFGEFLRTRLFEPLGMSDTASGARLRRSTASHPATCPAWRGDEATGRSGESTYAEPPSLESGGGAWFRLRMTTCGSAG